MSNTYMDFLVCGEPPKDQSIIVSPSRTIRYNWWSDKCAYMMLEAYSNPDNYAHGVVGKSEFTTHGQPDIDNATILATHYHSGSVPTSNTGNSDLNDIHGLGTTIAAATSITDILNSAVSDANAGKSAWNTTMNTIQSAVHDVQKVEKVSDKVGSWVEEKVEEGVNDVKKFIDKLFF